MKTLPVPPKFPMEQRPIVDDAGWFNDDKKDRVVFAAALLIAFCLLFVLFVVFFKQQVVSFEPKLIRYTSGPVITHNVQASHSKFNWKPYLNLTDAIGYTWGELYGNSMQPTFFEDNIALTMSLPEDYIIKTGEIVRYYREDCPIIDATNESMTGGTYLNNTMAVIHRVEAVYEDDIIVRGDNLLEEEVIKRCQITHIVIGILFT